MALATGFPTKIIAEVGPGEGFFFHIVAADTQIGSGLSQQTGMIRTMDFMAIKTTFFQWFMTVFAIEC